MLVLGVTAFLLLIAAGFLAGAKHRPANREELLALQRYYEKAHREEALPFD